MSPELTNPNASKPTPVVFVSYAWEPGDAQEPHCVWVENLAKEIRASGAQVFLDQWELQGGDNIIEFMKKIVSEATVVVAICTPLFAAKSNAGEGGVGYEQQIFIATTLAGRLRAIPVLCAGDPSQSIPTYLDGRLYIDLRQSNPRELSRLIDSIHSRAPAREPVRSVESAREPRITRGAVLRWFSAALITVAVALTVVQFALRDSIGAWMSTTGTSPAEQVTATAAPGEGAVTTTTTGTSPAEQVTPSAAPPEGTVTTTTTGTSPAEEVTATATPGEGTVTRTPIVETPELGIVAGTVTDAMSGRGVAGAVVRAGDERTMTDSAGVFRLLLPRGQRVLLSVERLGYVPRPATETVIPPQESVRVKLMKASSPEPQPFLP